MLEFYGKLAKIINNGKSRSILLTGNINDMFFDGKEFSPLVDFLAAKCQISPTDTSRGVTVVVYEINRAIRVVNNEQELRSAFNEFKGIVTTPQRTTIEGTRRKEAPQQPTNDFDALISQSVENPTLAMEFLRQLTVASRKMKLKNDLVVVIEAADFLLPVGQTATLGWADRRRIAVVQDWLSDPKFMNGHDSVIFMAETRGLINQTVAQLPQLLEVAISSPNLEERRQFRLTTFPNLKVIDRIDEMSAALTLHAYRQLLCDGEGITVADVTDKVAEFVVAQIGEDVVEFKKPKHTLNDVVGFTQIKRFLREEFIPRIKNGGDEALSGAAVGGPIGGGKTFVFEGAITELDMPVMVLKNFRSQWYGQSDVIFERIRRVAEALDRLAIFVDEADTQFGGVGADTHETERRLTGKIQSMMSDPRLKGRVIWLLLTARINLLSPDIRRPGRVGDLIIPILDPEGEDQKDFINWMIKPTGVELDESGMQRLVGITKDYSAATYASLRSRLKAKKVKTLEEVLVVLDDMIDPNIGNTRRYQTLQALVNCTRRSLLPDWFKADTEKFKKEMTELERKL
jgi:AAA+ superfamily predicted ATPase